MVLTPYQSRVGVSSLLNILTCQFSISCIHSYYQEAVGIGVNEASLCPPSQPSLSGNK